MVSSVQSLLNLIASKAKKIIIRLPADLGQEKLFELKALLGAAKGFCEVAFIFKEGEKETFITTPSRIMLHKALIDFLDENLPPNSWDFE